MPPLLAAAIAWDAWLSLEPDQRGAWQAPLIAALVLKARAKTRHILQPLNTGQRSCDRLSELQSAIGSARLLWHRVIPRRARLCSFELTL